MTQKLFPLSEELPAKKVAKLESTTDESAEAASEEADRRAAKEVESILGGNPVIDIPGLDEFVGTHESEYNFIFIECVKPLSYYSLIQTLSIDCSLSLNRRRLSTKLYSTHLQKYSASYKTLRTKC